MFRNKCIYAFLVYATLEPAGARWSVAVCIPTLEPEYEKSITMLKAVFLDTTEAESFFKAYLPEQIIQSLDGETLRLE